MDHRREMNGYAGIVELIKIQTHKGASNKIFLRLQLVVYSCYTKWIDTK